MGEDGQEAAQLPGLPGQGRGWEGDPACAWSGLAKDCCWTLALLAEVRWC